MRKLVSILLAAMMLLSTVPALADTLLPYNDEEEIVYHGLASDLGMEDNESSIVMQAYRDATGRSVKIEWELLGWGDWLDKLNVLCSSGNIPDILWVTPVQDYIYDYAETGIFLNLRDYADYMPNWMAVNESKASFSSLWGKNQEIYAVTDVDEYDLDEESFFVNTTALAELNAEVPTTWAEAIALMEQYKALHPNSTPFFTHMKSVDQAIMYSLNGRTGMFYNTATSSWDYAPLAEDQSHYKQVVELMREMYEKGLISPEYDILTEEQINQIYISGEWLFCWGTAQCPANAFNGNFSSVPYTYEHMVPPVLNEGDTPYNFVNFRSDVPGDYGYLINANVEKPELLCSLLDYMISADASRLFNWGIEGVTYDINAETGKPEYIGEYATSAEARKEAGIYNFNDLRFIMYKDRYSDIARLDPSIMAKYRDLNNAFREGKMNAWIPEYNTPVLDSAAKETVSINLSPISTYVSEQVPLFVVGERDMSEWDAFLEEIRSMGNIDAVIEVYNAGQQVPSSDTRNWMEF